MDNKGGEEAYPTMYERVETQLLSTGRKKLVAVTRQQAKNKQYSLVAPASERRSAKPILTVMCEELEKSRYQEIWKREEDGRRGGNGCQVDVVGGV